jgi:hypothetical protein
MISEFYFGQKKKVFLQNTDFFILKENFIVVKRLMFDRDIRAVCTLKRLGSFSFELTLTWFDPEPCPGC